MTAIIIAVPVDNSEAIAMIIMCVFAAVFFALSFIDPTK